jgi:hypothetical protein
MIPQAEWLVAYLRHLMGLASDLGQFLGRPVINYSPDWLIA